jgi:VanZ family protein
VKGPADVLKPSDLPAAARALLVLGGLFAAVLMLVPALRGAETALGLNDKQAHAAAFYIFCLAAFLAAPRMRRNDIALAALALGAGAEVAQLVTGRSASFGDLMADAVGIGLAWAPAQIEQLRRLAREHPGKTFRQIRDGDRRRPAAPAASPLAETSPS